MQNKAIKESKYRINKDEIERNTKIYDANSSLGRNNSPSLNFSTFNKSNPNNFEVNNMKIVEEKLLKKNKLQLEDSKKTKLRTFTKKKYNSTIKSKICF